MGKRYEVLRVRVEGEIMVLREVPADEVSDMDRFEARDQAANNGAWEALRDGTLGFNSMDITPSVVTSRADALPERWDKGCLIYHETGLGEVTVERALDLAGVEGE